SDGGREPGAAVRSRPDADAPLHDRGDVQPARQQRGDGQGLSQQWQEVVGRPCGQRAMVSAADLAVCAEAVTLPTADDRPLTTDERAMTTPMMQQYREAKERHPGMLLLFRAGDFYELFYEDAELVSRVLGIALPSRDGKAPMAGFPHHALEVHLRKLLRSGHRVAICDQVEDAAQAKGRLIRREVTRVVTPGT